MAQTKTQNTNWRKRVDKYKSRIIISSAFFGTLIAQMETVERRQGNPTCATDGLKLYVNPDFTETLDDDTLHFVIYHEVFHVALDHIPRLKGRNHELWNVACDYVVNLMVKDHAPNLPTPKNCYYDQRFKGMSAEEVYTILDKEKAEPDPTKGIGEFMLPPGSGGDVERLLADIKIRVHQAAIMAKSKNAGRLPSFIETILEAAKPQEDWRPYVRQFIDDACQKDYSWSTRSRRSTDEYYLPGTRNDGMGHLVMILDTSASMTDDTLNKAVAETLAAAEAHAIAKITVIQADAKVQNVTEYQMGDDIHIKAVGRGGTDFAPAFEYVSKHCDDAKLIVYFTDMECTNYGPEPSQKVLWAGFNSKTSFDYYAAQLPWGTPIHITDIP